jgi:hypothetical protein
MGEAFITKQELSYWTRAIFEGYYFEALYNSYAARNWDLIATKCSTTQEGKASAT